MFDYSYHMKVLVADITRRCSAFAHVDAEKLLIGISRSRNRKRHGLQAKLMPLKFKGGLRTGQIGGAYYEMPNMTHGGGEILYVIYFCLPRFQNLGFNTKMATIFHELYHINPDCNGDIRRFPGRFYQHSHSEKNYDRIVRDLSGQYLRDPATADPTRFLRHSYNELRSQYGEVGGLRVLTPEPVLLEPKQGMLFGPEQKWWSRGEE